MRNSSRPLPLPQWRRGRPQGPDFFQDGDLRPVNFKSTFFHKFSEKFQDIPGCEPSSWKWYMINILPKPFKPEPVHVEQLQILLKIHWQIQLQTPRHFLIPLWIRLSRFANNPPKLSPISFCWEAVKAVRQLVEDTLLLHKILFRQNHNQNDGLGGITERQKPYYGIHLLRRQ